MTDAELLDSCRPAWLEAICHSLNELLTRESDWDGRQGHAASFATVKDALEVVNLVQCGTCPLPYLSMDSDGNVELAWHGGGIRIEIEVDGSGVAKVFVRAPGFADIERAVQIFGGDFRFVTAAITRLEPVAA